MKRLVPWLAGLGLLVIGSAVLGVRTYPLNIQGADSSSAPVVADYNMTTLFTSGQCADFTTTSTANGPVACTNSASRRYFGQTTLITGLEVVTHDAGDGNDGCEFVLVTGQSAADSGTDATLSSRPVIGDQSPGAGFTLLDTDGEVVRVSTSVVVAAGGYAQVRFSDVAGAGSSTGACSTTDPNVFIFIY